MHARDTDDEEEVARQPPIAAGARAEPLAFLGAVVGGIVGWLLSAGAVPHPDFLPAPPDQPLQAALVFAALGAFGGGILGGIARLADRTQE
jgi:hypothetical protein